MGVRENHDDARAFAFLSLLSLPEDCSSVCKVAIGLISLPILQHALSSNSAQCKYQLSLNTVIYSRDSSDPLPRDLFPNTLILLRRPLPLDERCCILSLLPCQNSSIPNLLLSSPFIGFRVFFCLFLCLCFQAFWILLHVLIHCLTHRLGGAYYFFASTSGRSQKRALQTTLVLSRLFVSFVKLGLGQRASLLRNDSLVRSRGERRLWQGFRGQRIHSTPSAKSWHLEEPDLYIRGPT